MILPSLTTYLKNQGTRQIGEMDVLLATSENLSQMVSKGQHGDL
jgi:hypothetical protein